MKEVDDLDSAMLYEKPSPMDIVHEGRLGMKWGRRNGPPYPLGSSQLSAAEKKEGGVSPSAKERDGGSSDSGSSATKKAENKIYRETKAKRYKKISDEDLAASTTRLENEKKYKELMQAVYADPDKEYAKSLMKRTQADVVAAVAKNIEVKVGTALATKGVNALYKAITGKSDDLIGLDDAVDGIDKKFRLEMDKLGFEKEKFKQKVADQKVKEEEKAKRKAEKEAEKKASKKEEAVDADYTEIWTGKVEGRGTSSGRSAYERHSDVVVVTSQPYLEDGRKYLEDRFQYPAVR